MLTLLVSMFLVVGFAITVQACDGRDYCDYKHHHQAYSADCKECCADLPTEIFFTNEVFQIKLEYIENDNLAGFLARIASGDIEVFTCLHEFMMANPVFMPFWNNCCGGVSDGAFFLSSGTTSHTVVVRHWYDGFVETAECIITATSYEIRTFWACTGVFTGNTWHKTSISHSRC